MFRCRVQDAGHARAGRAVTGWRVSGGLAAVGGGKVMSMASPPPGRGCAVMVASWAVAMAWTMARPRPWPPSRRGGGGVGGGLSDGRPGAVAAVAGGGTRAEPLKGLEQAIDVGGRDKRPGAGHGQDGPSAARRGGGRDR